MTARELAHTWMDELSDEEFNAMMSVLRIIHNHSKNSQKKKSVKGAWSFAADQKLVSLEKSAWEAAAVEKHMKFMEDNRNENS